MQLEYAHEEVRYKVCDIWLIPAREEGEEAFTLVGIFNELGDAVVERDAAGLGVIRVILEERVSFSRRRIE